MKKKIIMAIGIIAAAAILGVGIYHSDASQSASNLTTDEIEEMVTNQYPGEITDINLKKQANKSVYQVDIENDVRTYVLTLESDTGEVMELKETSDPEQVKVAEKKAEAKQAAQKEKNDEKKSAENKEKEVKEPNKKENNDNDTESTDKKNTVINVDKAIEIALEQFSGEVDEVELEEQDGRLIYEIEIENGEDEAEVEIDAYTGEVLVVSIEKDD